MIENEKALMENDKRLCYEFKEYVENLGIKLPNSFNNAIKPILLENKKEGKQKYSR